MSTPRRKPDPARDNRSNRSQKPQRSQGAASGRGGDRTDDASGRRQQRGRDQAKPTGRPERGEAAPGRPRSQDAGSARGGERKQDAAGGKQQRGRRQPPTAQRPNRRDAEGQLSHQAQARLRKLRAEHDPRDDDRPQGARDAYADVPGGIRLQKALAQAGVASRRASEELIAQGRVEVDGHVVRRFGARVDVENSEIRVDGHTVVTAPDKRYYALNKPRGVVSTMSDPQGRPTLADYAAETGQRLFHVGRLDTETEGLILLTNDGELANRLTHPRYRILKTYIATVPGPVPREAARLLRDPVELDDGPVEVTRFRVVDNAEPRALVEVALHEGRNHIVRRLLEAVGLPVSDLARTQVGPVGLHSLKTGTLRSLTAREVSELYSAAGM